MNLSKASQVIPLREAQAGLPTGVADEVTALKENGRA